MTTATFKNYSRTNEERMSALQAGIRQKLAAQKSANPGGRTEIRNAALRALANKIAEEEEEEEEEDDDDGDDDEEADDDEEDEQSDTDTADLQDKIRAVEARPGTRAKTQELEVLLKKAEEKARTQAAATRQTIGEGEPTSAVETTPTVALEAPTTAQPPVNVKQSRSEIVARAKALSASEEFRQATSQTSNPGPKQIDRKRPRQEV